jgi:hypothetical protein
VIEAEDAARRELVTRIADAGGYAVTREDRALRIACPASFAEALDRQAREAGVTDLTIRVKEASLEQVFLALVRGDRP